MRSLPQSLGTRTLASELGKLVEQEHFASNLNWTTGSKAVFVFPIHLEASYHVGEYTGQVLAPVSAQLGSQSLLGDLGW